MVPYIRYCLAFSFLISFIHSVQAAPAVKIQSKPLMDFTVAPYFQGTQKNYWPKLHFNTGASFSFNRIGAIWGAVGIESLPELSFSALPPQHTVKILKSGVKEVQGIDTSGTSLFAWHTGGGIRFAPISNLIVGLYYYQDAICSKAQQGKLADLYSHCFNINHQGGIEVLHTLCRLNLGYYYHTNDSAALDDPQNRVLSSNLYQASSDLLLPLQGTVTAKVSMLSGAIRPFFASYYIPDHKKKYMLGGVLGCEYHVHPMLNTSLQFQYDALQDWRFSIAIQMRQINSDNSKNIAYEGSALHLSTPINRAYIPLIFKQPSYIRQIENVANSHQTLGLKNTEEVQVWLENKAQHDATQYLLKQQPQMSQWMREVNSMELEWEALLQHAYPANNNALPYDEEGAPYYSLWGKFAAPLTQKSNWPDKTKELFRIVASNFFAHNNLIEAYQQLMPVEDYNSLHMPGGYKEDPASEPEEDAVTHNEETESESEDETADENTISVNSTAPISSSPQSHFSVPSSPPPSYTSSNATYPSLDNRADLPFSVRPGSGSSSIDRNNLPSSARTKLSGSYNTQVPTPSGLPRLRRAVTDSQASDVRPPFSHVYSEPPASQGPQDTDTQSITSSRDNTGRDSSATRKPLQIGDRKKVYTIRSKGAEAIKWEYRTSIRNPQTQQELPGLIRYIPDKNQVRLYTGGRYYTLAGIRKYKDYARKKTDKSPEITSSEKMFGMKFHTESTTDSGVSFTFEKNGYPYPL